MVLNSKKKKPKRTTLEFRLIIAGLTSVFIPFFVAGTIIFFQLSNSLLELTKEKAIHMAHDVSASINEMLMQEIKLVLSIAADPDIIDASKTGDYQIAQVELENVYERIGQKHFTIFLTDKDGIARADASFKEQIKLDLSDRDYFVQAKEGKAGVSDPIMPKGTATPGTPIIVIYAAIQDKGKFCGMVAIPIEIDFIINFLEQHHIGRTSYSYLINDEGRVLVHPVREFIFKLAPLVQPGTDEIKRLLLEKKDGFATYTFKGTTKVAGLSRMKLTGWTCVFSQDRKEIMAPVHQIIFSIFISGIIFVTITALIFILSSIEIATPIEKMLSIQKQITRHSTEIFFQIGLDKKIIFANPAFEKITGLKVENIIGTEPCLDNPNNLPPAVIWDTLESGNSWSGRVMLKTNRPDIVTLDVMVVPIRDGHGAIQGYLQLGRNITAELMYEKRLLQGQKLEAIGTLAGGIAHDFNNILSVIFGYAELSLNGKKCDAETERYIRQITAASERARDLINQILTFSRNTDIELRPLLPKSVLKEVVKLLRASIPAHIDIQSKMDCDSLIMAEPTQLHQIVMNLFMNAAHSIGEKTGTITLKLEDFLVDKEFARTHPDITEGKHVRIRISDTGGGIEPEILEKIFEPFFTTKPQDQGTGLGLSVVHGIVKRLNGIVSVYSELEKGTVFNIVIPCTEADGSMRDHQKSSLRQGSETIVVIDDEQSIAATLQTILANIGYKVTAYTNSLEALKAIENNPNEIDIIISDYSMPQMSGLEIAEKLNAAGIKIPILLMSGFIRKDIEDVAKRIGIAELIAKPINSYQITDAIGRIMEG